MAHHKITSDGPRYAGHGWHRTVRHAIECSCGEVSLGETRADALPKHEAHVPPEELTRQERP